MLDLSGSFRTGHPHSLSLVSAVARVVEDKLSQELDRRDERLRALYLERIAPGPGSTARWSPGRGGCWRPRPVAGWGRASSRRRATGWCSPSGVEVRAEPIGDDAGAVLVRTAPRRRAPSARSFRVEALARGRAAS